MLGVLFVEYFGMITLAFWSGAYEKPTAFVDRLDQVEDYLNERLVMRILAVRHAVLAIELGH